MNIRVETPIKEAPAWKVWVALWAVYLVWGSTYLAIRVTVETLPPFLAGGIRFIIAGAVMYGFLAARRGRSAVTFSLKELGAATLIGSLLLFVANGLVMVAEQDVPSALAALIIASVPLWVIVFRAVVGEKMSIGTLLGVVVGFAGVALLVMSDGGSNVEAGTLGVALLVVASIAWAGGSFLSKRVPLPADPFVSTALQMLTGGAILIVAGLATGELDGFGDVSTASVVGLAYLVGAGSLIGFTAYTWVLQHAPISKVATYAYVNPVVAIFLGWIVLSENITVTMLVGATVIISSVAFIIRKESKPAVIEELVESGPPPDSAEPRSVPASETT